MAAAATRDGIVISFEIFWVSKAIPISYWKYKNNKRVDFLLHQDDSYKDTCPKLAAHVDYTEHTIMISMVNDEVIQYANAGAADSLFEFKIDADKWQQVVENHIGTFEQNKDILDQQMVNAALESRKANVPKNVEKVIKSYLGGKRKTRKQTRRKNY